MFRQKTTVRLAHTTVHHQYGGGQTGSLSEVLYEYATDRTKVTPGSQPMPLTCKCGEAFMFRLHGTDEHRRLFWRTLGRRFLILVVAYALTSFGAFLAFSVGHEVWMRVIGTALFAPGLVASLVTLWRLLFGAPKRFTLKPLADVPARGGSVQTYHSVELS